MCKWNYLHHHHLPPCPRPIDIVVVYTHYCGRSTTHPATGEPQPCSEAQFDDSVDGGMNQVGVDYDNPCAATGCVVSPECSSGGCRLAALGGRWACCRCGGRGNEYRWCRHRMRTSPDTFCYHVCCAGCRPDDAAYFPSSSSPSAAAGGAADSSSPSAGSSSSPSSSPWSGALGRGSANRPEQR